MLLCARSLARSLACVVYLLRTHPLLLCIMASVQGVLLNVSAISSSSACIAPVAQQSVSRRCLCLDLFFFFFFFFGLLGFLFVFIVVVVDVGFLGFFFLFLLLLLHVGYGWGKFFSFLLSKYLVLCLFSSPLEL